MKSKTVKVWRIGIGYVEEDVIAENIIDAINKVVKAYGYDVGDIHYVELISSEVMLFGGDKSE